MPPPRIASLLNLLDDENEQVQQGIQQALLDYQGDATDELTAAGLRLKTKQAKLLSEKLHPGRRTVLREEWSVPTERLNRIDGDWESLEGLLRMISDFLHDGITMRQSLSDELDQLADQAAEKVETPLALARYLFATGKFAGNRQAPFDIRNSDLAWSIQEGESNPLGLNMIYMLVAQRLELPVFGCNYPGHFLALIDHNNQPTLIDPFHKGRAIPVRQLVKEHPEISQEARTSLKQPCTLTDILKRLLANLHLAFAKDNRTEDAELVEELLLTLPSS